MTIESYQIRLERHYKGKERYQMTIESSQNAIENYQIRLERQYKENECYQMTIESY